MAAICAQYRLEGQEIASLPWRFYCSSEWGAGRRSEIFARRKGSGFRSFEVGLGLFAEIPRLAKVRTLDFVAVTGLCTF